MALIFRKSDWEANFREKSEVISTAEMVCCRRIVELCRHMITAGYYYHCVSCRKSQAKQRRLGKKSIVVQNTGIITLIFGRSSSQFPTHHSPYSTLPKSTSLPTIKQVSTATKQRSVSCTRVHPPSIASSAVSSPYSKPPTALVSRKQSLSKPVH